MWHQAVDRLPLPERVGRLQAAGFAGLVLDRAALPDAGRACDDALARLGAGDRIDSRDGTLAFYGLPAPGVNSPTLHSMPTAAGRGFYPEEGDAPHRWNWSSGNAELFVYHAGDDLRPSELTCVLQSLTPRQVTIRSPDEHTTTAQVAGGDGRVALRLPVTLHPGWNLIRYETDRPAVPPRADETCAPWPSWCEKFAWCQCPVADPHHSRETHLRGRVHPAIPIGPAGVRGRIDNSCLKCTDVSPPSSFPCCSVRLRFKPRPRRTRPPRFP